MEVKDGANTVAEFEYDGLHRRIVKEEYVGGSLDKTRRFYYSTAWQVLEERVDSATTAHKQYVWGARYIDDLVLRDRDADANTGNGLEERLYVTQDALFNVTALTNSSGAVQERIEYNPYGKNADADPFEQYTWHPYYIDALAMRVYDADTDGVLNENNDGDHYYTQDANFNVTAVTNASGSVLERYAYSPYGELTVLDPDFSNDADGVSDIENPVTYTGREFDVETGLYEYRHRYVHPTLGMFVRRDPIGYGGSQSNLYNYVRNSPVDILDPSGLAPNQEGATDPQHLVDRICELEAECELTDAEILEKIKEEHGGETDRYFYTDKYGWVDIRHFSAAADLAEHLGQGDCAILGNMA